MSLDLKLTITVMSGVEDGSMLSFNADNNGKLTGENWFMTVGRRDENDLCLRNDTFVSRIHANIHWREKQWWLEDCNSTNGTFIENPSDFFEEIRVNGTILIAENQLFRIGRTWLRIQPPE